MADNAGSRFFEGLRVTADHLRHVQDRLWEAVTDLRITVGPGKVAWGLRAVISGTQAALSPGVAFSTSGLRLAIDTDLTLPLPDPGDSGPWVLILRAVNEDRESLRFGGQATLVTLRAEALIEPVPVLMDPDKLVIAEIAASGAGFEISQASSLFAAAGHHRHSGDFVQDEEGRWRYDGAPVAGLEELGERIEAFDELEATPGPEGPRGPRGLKGTAGVDGSNGTNGAVGGEGPPGPPGLQGEQGLQGERGQRGARGSAGQAGQGLDEDWPAVGKVSWPHAGEVTAQQATRILGDVVFTLTSPADDRFRDPKIHGHPVQVWFEPASDGQVSSILTFPGATSIEDTLIRWKPLNLDNFANAIGPGGRLLFRLHCGAMFDQNGRAYSHTLDEIIAISGPRAPGGVFESWLNVARG